MDTQRIITDFNRHQRARSMVDATVEWREFLLRRFFKWMKCAGIAGLRDVKRRHIVNYQMYVSQLRNRRGQLYDPRVQNTHLIAVQRLYEFLEMTGDVDANPAKGLMKPNAPKRLPRSILTSQQVEALMSKPDTRTWLGIRDRCMLELIYSTAIRRSEVIKLNIEDIDPVGRTLHIREGKYCKDRIVPYGKTAEKWLVRYIKEVRPLRTMNPEERALFISNRRCRIGKQGIKEIFGRCNAKLNLPCKITPHTLRHSCATHMHDAGANLMQIQQLLGHTDTDKTAIYIRMSIERLRKIHAQFHPGERNYEPKGE